MDKLLIINATEFIDNYYYRKTQLDSIDEFLSRHIKQAYQGEIDKDNKEGLEIRTEQNQFIQSLLDITDSHPLSSKSKLAIPLRRLVWKHSGINCDNFKNLDIRHGVRFDNPEKGDLSHFNPKNITILTGGQKVFLTGLRGTTYLDASDKIVIYGPFNCASGVNIFTHDHVFDDPEKTQFEQGKKYKPLIIYPSCFVGEGSHVFGNLNLKTIVGGMSITPSKSEKLNPPYYAIGGVVAKPIVPYKLPDEFPTDYLSEVLKNVKEYSLKHGEHLEKYFEIVRDYITEMRGLPIEERTREWPSYQKKINDLEKELLR